MGKVKCIYHGTLNRKIYIYVTNFKEFFFSIKIWRKLCIYISDECIVSSPPSHCK